MENHAKQHGGHYLRLSIMIVLSFIAMYIFMYAMVNTFSDIFPNVNQFYMAGLMTSPMLIIELMVMQAMYPNKKINMAFLIAGILVLIGCYTGIRRQAAVSDEQFLKSMIPHHSSAILMCREADVKDPEIKKLCEEIMISQQKEIDLMKDKLKQLEKK